MIRNASDILFNSNERNMKNAELNKTNSIISLAQPLMATIAFPGSPSTLKIPHIEIPSIGKVKLRTYFMIPSNLFHAQYAKIATSASSNKNLTAKFNG